MEGNELVVKKGSLVFWFIAIAVLLIVVFLFVLSPKSSSTDVGIFTSNPSLYPSLGPDNAQNVVIEFSDFQCPICGMASGLPSWDSQYASTKGNGLAGQIEQAAQQGKVKFIFVPMSFLGQGSIYATEAALCANEQGKFWEMHDAIYSNQVPPAQEGVQFTKQQLEIMAGAITGLNQTEFSSCLESDSYSPSVQQINTAASNAGIKGTPTFIVNGKVLSDWTSASSVLG